jgi:hypothetical protein
LLTGVRTTHTNHHLRLFAARQRGTHRLDTGDVGGGRELLEKKKADLLKFRSDKTLLRVEKMGDLFEPVEN